MTQSGFETPSRCGLIDRGTRLGILLMALTLALPACQTANPPPPSVVPAAPAPSPQASAAAAKEPPPAPPAQASAPAAPPPPEPAAFDLAIERAATALFSSAERIPDLIARAPRAVMIDPLIDGNTAQQTTASAAMGRKIADVINSKFNRFAVTPFRKQSLGRVTGRFTGQSNVQ